MKFGDLIYISMQNFKNRKSRVFFTILGVSVAIAVVLSLVSFGYGLQKNLLDQITTSDSLLSLDVTPSDPEIIHFDQKMMDAIATIPHVEKVSPQATFSGQVSYDGVISESAIDVVAPEFFLLDGQSPVSGKTFKKGDVR
ncbi:ABC transporter permease, partial [Patescibacteria group bacterium]|nr:ABC transporter permease [Patescibacteria group bacterium]